MKKIDGMVATESDSEGGIEADHLLAKRLHAVALIKNNNEFNERLKELMLDNHNNRSPLIMGYPSPILLSCGFPNLPIEITVNKLTEKMYQSNHPFCLSSLVHMPDCVCNPIAVFRSTDATKPNSRVVLTEMTDKTGVNLVVVIELGRYVGGKHINDIRSVYPKDVVQAIFSWITKEPCLMDYCHKIKILDWIGKQQSVPAEVTKHIEDSTNVVQK